MNSIVQQQFEILDQTNALRFILLDTLTDEDLAYKLPGDNMTLGALCREMGETQHIYLESFRTFAHDYNYRHPDAEVEGSVDKLRAWYAEMDREMKDLLAALPEDDVHGKIIDRITFSVPVGIQFHLYREAVLIFCGKASLYLKALQKSPGEQFRHWIA